MCDVKSRGWRKFIKRTRSRSHSLFMFGETQSKKQQDRRSFCWLLLFALNIKKNYKTSTVRSRISSKLIFARWVRYFHRACLGFYVTSSRMLVLISGNKIWQLWNSYTKYVAMGVCSALFILVRRNIINSSMRRRDKWSCITWWTVYHTHTAILLSTVSHEQSDIPSTCTWTVRHSFHLSITK